MVEKGENQMLLSCSQCSPLPSPKKWVETQRLAHKVTKVKISQEVKKNAVKDTEA